MSKTILVVEDDSDMRALIDHHLLGAGYIVRAVANGLEAAAACLVQRSRQTPAGKGLA
jgi:CheY-like chemotaxis protein